MDDMRRDDDRIATPGEDEPPPGAEEARVDLSLLRTAPADAGQSQSGWEVLARRIELAAAPELGRRRSTAAAPLLALIARATRPVLLAAAAAAAFAVATARLAGEDGRASLAVADATPAIGVAQALRVDEPAASWLSARRGPSTADLAREIGLEDYVQ